ncbi:hypothetical protein ACH4UM_37405 [Streptomyces sp. NPDC020801]|uniref:hypothetical protein n=1 Tax=unclassified Streptomyces TaxID=2593676 RepID=UPI0037AB0213
MASAWPTRSPSPRWRRRIRPTFGRLRHDSRPLTEIDQALMDAFEWLMHGLSQTTDGRITVVNVCTGAGVSRASYHRSPAAQAVKEDRTS